MKNLLYLRSQQWVQVRDPGAPAWVEDTQPSSPEQGGRRKGLKNYATRKNDHLRPSAMK
jgi:hypothetical protein